LKTFNNEIVVHRNETFTMDKLIQNKNGSPYVISRELTNGYFLLTVSSTRYAQEKRYLVNYWLSLSDYPRFNYTDIFNLTEYGYTELPTELNENDELEIEEEGVPVLAISEGDCVFSIVFDDVTCYKYFTIDNHNVIWHDYECRFVKQFSAEDTAEWVEQSYLYSISVVSGPAVIDGDRPIDSFDTVITILPPTKMSVLSNLNGNLFVNNATNIIGG